MKLSSFVHFASFGVKTILFRKKEPILGTVIVTDKCNLKCKHCSVNNITAIVHPYEKVRKEMQTLYDMGVRILFFCGGAGIRPFVTWLLKRKKWAFSLSTW